MISVQPPCEEGLTDGVRPLGEQVGKLVVVRTLLDIHTPLLHVLGEDLTLSGRGSVGLLHREVEAVEHGFVHHARTGELTSFITLDPWCSQ